MSPLELLGYAASVLVAASLTLKSIVRLRVVNLLGAVCFTIYGALLGAWPVALVNGVIVLINVWHLTQMASAREYFRLLEVGPDSEYLREFLRFHARDISHFLPEFDGAAAPGDLVLFVLRDMVPAGLLLARPEGPGRLRARLDFVIPGYRDFKVGDFLFRRNAAAFTGRGYRTVVANPGHPEHAAYLRRMGFRPDPASPRAPYRLDV